MKPSEAFSSIVDLLPDIRNSSSQEPQPSKNRKRPSSGRGRGRAAATPPAKKAKTGRRAFVDDDDAEEEEDVGRGGHSARGSRMTESASQVTGFESRSACWPCLPS